MNSKERTMLDIKRLDVNKIGRDMLKIKRLGVKRRGRAMLRQGGKDTNVISPVANSNQ